MALSKASALRLASNAMDAGAVALRGLLATDKNDQFTIGDRNLSEWLNRFSGQELIIILAPVDTDLKPVQRECAVCGRDYQGSECPHCAEARARLRGR